MDQEILQYHKYTPGNQQVNSNSFTTISVIGKGSYAKVLLVKKKDNGQYFAMKLLKKTLIEQKKQQNHVQTERNILVEINRNPFLIDFYYSFQTQKALCFILEYCPGGELFNLLQKRRKFSEEQARFYAAQMVLAIEYLHSKEIVYRDLKPENVLIDSDGYIKITDFGLSRQNVKNNDAKSICGTPEYLAPEIILKMGYGKCVDWWTLGSIVYEMLTGVPPFYSQNKQDLFDKIKMQNPKYYPYMTPSAIDFISSLLKKDFSKRLGYQNDAQDVKAHQWFSTINWKMMIEKKYDPPFIPKITGNMGLTNFDVEFTEMTIESPMEMNQNGGNEHYEGFTWSMGAHNNLKNQPDEFPCFQMNLEPTNDRIKTQERVYF